MFAGNFAPSGWNFCQGQLMSISDYDTLFNLIGTSYGGDGQTNFALPDLQSRFPLHQGAGYPLSGNGGLERVSLNATQLPVHSHLAMANNAAAGSFTSALGNVWSGWNKPGYSNAVPTTAMSNAGLASAGSGQPHDNMPPYLAINFIISMFGIYPSPA
jgi:microcystin-dependent protein